MSNRMSQLQTVRRLNGEEEELTFALAQVQCKWASYESNEVKRCVESKSNGLESRVRINISTTSKIPKAFLQLQSS